MGYLDIMLHVDICCGKLNEIIAAKTPEHIFNAGYVPAIELTGKLGKSVADSFVIVSSVAQITAHIYFLYKETKVRYRPTYLTCRAIVHLLVSHRVI